MSKDRLIKWLLSGDVSIQYQVYRDLLGADKTQLRNRISSEGWGARFLRKRNKEGHWGRGFYMPKWTSTHYTVLDLENLGIPLDNKEIRQSISTVVGNLKAEDGGIFPMGPEKSSDPVLPACF